MNWIGSVYPIRALAWRIAPNKLKSPSNDYDSAIGCTGRLQNILSEAKNASMERTHTPMCFQLGLFS